MPEDSGFTWRRWAPAGVPEVVDWIGARLPQASPELKAHFRALEAEQQAYEAERDRRTAELTAPVKRFFGKVGEGLKQQFAPAWTPTPEAEQLATMARDAIGRRAEQEQAAFPDIRVGVGDQDYDVMAPMKAVSHLQTNVLPNFAVDTALDLTTPLGALSNVVNVGPALKGLGMAAAVGRKGAGKALAGTAAVDRARRTLAERWPSLAAAVEKHGAEVTLPGARRSEATALDRLAADIHARTLQHGGSTTYPLTGAQEIPGQSTGFMVGKYSNQSGLTESIPLPDFTPEHVRAFIEKHADEYARRPAGEKTPLAVGAWIEDVEGQPHVFLDVAQKYPTARKATVAGAYQRQPPTVARPKELIEGREVAGAWPKAQLGIFDLQRGETLPVGNFAEFVGSPEFRQRLDQMFEAGVPVMEDKNWWPLYGTSLERVYGKKNIPMVAGALAATSSGAPPVHNLRAGSEYIRRLITGEPIIQPRFRIPETAVGSLPGSIGGQVPGDFNRPGTRMPMEATRAPNLRRVAEGDYESLMRDKMNDMYHALTGVDVGVYDRRYAKLAEKPAEGIYVSGEKDKVPGTMGTTQVSPYALIENAVRDAAAAKGMDLSKYSATVWEGIGDTIKRTGELYGVKHPAHTIPEASQGFAGIFDKMVKEKAKAWGISVKEFERRLRRGDAELLTAILATPAGLAAYQQWQQGDQPTGSASPPARPVQ